MNVTSHMESVMRIDLDTADQFHVKRPLGLMTWNVLYIDVRSDHFELFGRPLHGHHEENRAITKCTFPCDFDMPKHVEHIVRQCTSAIRRFQSQQKDVAEDLNNLQSSPTDNSAGDYPLTRSKEN